MAGSDEKVRLETTLDERAGFAPLSVPDSPANLAPAGGHSSAPPARGLSPTLRGISVFSPALPPAVRRRLRPALREAYATEWERGTAFLFVPVFLAAGALAYFALNHEPGFSALGVSVVVLGALAWLARSRLVLNLVLAALICLVLGMLFAKIETWRAGTKMLGGEISTRLTGRVVVIEHMASGRVRLTLDVIGTERPKLKYAPDRVRVSARAIPSGLRAGDAVAGIVRLAPPSGPTRPGGYDFAFRSYFNGIGAGGFFLKAPERVADESPTSMASRFLALVENLRSSLAGRIRTAIDGGAEGEIAAALIAGVMAGIPDDANEALRRTGLAHILSIGGTHMVMVAAAIMLPLRAGFALFPGFASRRPVKKYAAAIALMVLFLYLFISGWQVAAERSFIMIAVMLLAVLFDRSALTMRNLAVSAIIIIALSPHEAAGPSFQMSFAATAALIGAYAAWSERKLHRPPARTGHEHAVPRAVRKAGTYIAGLAVTSLVAGAATTVYSVYFFQRVSPLGLLTNLAAMPIVSAVVMPFGLVGMALMPFGLDQWAFAVMGMGLTAMIAIAEWFSAMSPVDAVGLVPDSAVLLLTLALVLATLPTTWLRVTAVPFLAAGLLMVMMRTLPDAMISEDGRLVAMRSSDGMIAVNRMRPNAFTTDDWQRVLKAETVVKPKNAAEAGLLDATSNGEGFRCSGDVCAARLTEGALFVHAANTAAAQPFCEAASLIVIDDATAKNPCPRGSSKTVTRRDLARHGSASVTFLAKADKPVADVSFAIDEPYRPWHAHRAFSREARGLAPYERRKTDGAADKETVTPGS